MVTDCEFDFYSHYISLAKKVLPADCSASNKLAISTLSSGPDRDVNLAANALLKAETVENSGLNFFSGSMRS